MSPKEKYLLLNKRHIKFFQRLLSVLPYSTVSFDTSRMTILFFALSGLDILQALHEIDPQEKLRIIDWIYSLQVLPSKTEQCVGGFRGGSSLMGLKAKKDESYIIDLDSGHITMTYCALASLVILGDDLSGVNKPAVANHISSLQNSDGSFFSTIGGSENDLRFTYCAATVCYILNDFSALNVEAAVKYILATKSYEGALGQDQFQEAHGGSTFCGVASLYLMDKLNALVPEQKDRLVRWLILRHDPSGGLTGRPNKKADTCYTFWVGATLKLLGEMEYLDEEPLKEFVLATQNPITGGFGKHVGALPDGIHSYLGISGLALLSKASSKLGLSSIEPALNISNRALKHLHLLHKRWQNK